MDPMESPNLCSAESEVERARLEIGSLIVATGISRGSLLLRRHSCSRLESDEVIIIWARSLVEVEVDLETGRAASDSSGDLASVVGVRELIPLMREQSEESREERGNSLRVRASERLWDLGRLETGLSL